jgi:penicillin-binding protein 2
MCLIANKGYFYTPHFVKEIDNETAEDTVLHQYREKHAVLTHIPDTAFRTIILGMNDVVTHGTARSAAIPGINVCAKTGTAENYRIIDGKRVKLKDNSVFVAFAPMENPRIAIAVVVENAGFGGTWAGPISSLMMEKYLNDTLRPVRVKEVERISGSNLMPGWLTREQFKADSSRAYFYFNLTKDSSYIKKYIRRAVPVVPKKDSVKKPTPAPVKPVKPAQPKPEPPASPDSGRLGYLHRDEMWDNRLSKKGRSSLS